MPDLPLLSFPQSSPSVIPAVFSGNPAEGPRTPGPSTLRRGKRHWISVDTGMTKGGPECQWEVGMSGTSRPLSRSFPALLCPSLPPSSHARPSLRSCPTLPPVMPDIPLRSCPMFPSGHARWLPLLSFPQALAGIQRKAPGRPAPSTLRRGKRHWIPVDTGMTMRGPECQWEVGMSGTSRPLSRSFPALLRSCSTFPPVMPDLPSGHARCSPPVMPDVPLRSCPLACPSVIPAGFSGNPAEGPRAPGPQHVAEGEKTLDSR